MIMKYVYELLAPSWQNADWEIQGVCFCSPPPIHLNPSKKSQANTYLVFFFTGHLHRLVGNHQRWGWFAFGILNSVLPNGANGPYGKLRRPETPNGCREMRWMDVWKIYQEWWLFVLVNVLLWLRAANCKFGTKKMSGRCGRTNHWTTLPLDGGGLNIFFLHHHLEKITSWMIFCSQMGWNHQRQFQCLVSSNRFPCWTRFSFGRKLSQCWSRTRRAPFFQLFACVECNVFPRTMFQQLSAFSHTKLTLYDLGVI